MELPHSLSALLLFVTCIYAPAECELSSYLAGLTPSSNPSAVGNELSTLADAEPSPTTAGRISEKKCSEYSGAVYTDLLDMKIDNCPKVTEPLVVKGKNAVPREFPHMALVGYGTNRSRIAWRCGGSLISERFVLSAAHCSDAGGKLYVPTSANAVGYSILLLSTITLFALKD